MKKFIVMMTLATALTSNAYALQAIAVTYGAASLAGTSLGVSSSVNGVDCTIGQGGCKEAIQIIEDSQGYMQTGELSLFLAQKVRDAQSADSSLSQDEALDLLNDQALEILK